MRLPVLFLSSYRSHISLSLQAELSIHLPAAPSSDNLVALIRVYHVFQDKNSPKISSAQVKAHKVKLRTDAGGRVDINVTRLTR